MKTVYVMLAGVFLLCASVVKVNAADDIKSKVKGKWEVNIPDAPEGYNKYVCEFKEKDGVILMGFEGSGFEVKDQKFTEKDGKLTSTLYVGEYVKIIIWEEKGVVKGTADASIGLLPFSLKKVEEKKAK